MIGKTISHYKILEKLGEGGMGVVYKAHDTKLERTVAIKFLSSGHAVTEHDKTRFIHEARAASALEHSNICVIYEIDETPDGQMFLVMPCYEGIPLNKTIEEKPLAVNEAIDIAIQIADGLQAAHEKGIVHRDVKSSNIFISSKGQVKVMDFGLARSAGMTQVTKTGTTVGTVPYMSPEQAQGEKVDHRTDIWSLGVILYEMIAGRLPFKSEYSEAVVYSILNEEPEPLTSLRSNVPMELEHIVNKALAKDRDERYRHTDELATDLLRVKKLLESGATKQIPVQTKLRSQRRTVRRILFPALFIAVGFAVALFLFYPSEAIPFTERDWIIIADFENKTGDAIFDQSLNTALTVSIQQSRYVNVFSQVRIQQTLQRMQRDNVVTLDAELAREIALREGIKVLVIPTISRIGSNYSLTATIIEPATQMPLMSKTSQAKDEGEVLKALDNLAKQIRRSLGESLLSIANQHAELPAATTSSLEALKIYTEGKRLGGRDKAARYDLLNQAVTIDPDFALAHAELGMAYYIDGMRQRGDEHFNKALSLMDRLTLRERLWIRAVVEDWRGNRDEAIDNYKTYLTQYPDDHQGWFRIGYTYMITNRYEYGAEAFQKVIGIDPYEASAYINIASCYNGMGINDEALTNYQKGFELYPDMIKGVYVNNEYGFLLARMGEIDKARETFELMFTDEMQKARGLRSIALLNMYQGKYSIAIDYLREAVVLNKTFDTKLSEFRNHLYLVSLYNAKNMINEREQELGEVGRIISELYLGPFWLSVAGKAYVRMGRIEKANQLLQTIEERLGDYLAASGVSQNIRADQASYHMLRGEILLEKEDYKGAIESLEIAYNLTGRNLEPLARGYYVTGNPDKAIEKYLDIIADMQLGAEYQEDWIRAHYMLGQTFEQIADIENAVLYYKQFLDIWKDGDEDLIDLIDVKERLINLDITIGGYTYNNGTWP